MRITLPLIAAIEFAACFVTGHVLGQSPALVPEIGLVGRSEGSSRGIDFTRFNLTVKNAAEFPSDLFAPAPDLPPCGTNTNAARTWVDIYSAADDKRLNGFCNLKSPAELKSVWFAVQQGNAPPSAVYLVLHDRRTGHKYTSAPLPLEAAVSPAATGEPRPLPGAGAGTDSRIWKNLDGNSIVARFLSIKPENIVCLESWGKTYEVPISKLSVEDQIYLKSVQDGKSGTSSPPDTAEPRPPAVTADGNSSLEIQKLNRASPGILGFKERLEIQVKYKNGSGEGVQIWARPFTNGKSTGAYRAHGSPVYQPGEGTLTGFFYFEERVRVDEVRVNMVAGSSKTPLLTVRLPVDFTWQEGAKGANP